MNVAVWLARMAQARGAAPAVFLGKQPIWDYAAFHLRAGQVASWLRLQGIRPGDRVGIFMPNAPDYLTALYGI